MNQSCFILIGPEDRCRLQQIEQGTAPRLDYRLTAAQLDAAILECAPSPAALHGCKIARLFHSALRNLRVTARAICKLPERSLLYSTGETWGLPVALPGSRLGHRSRRYIHVMYVHRIFSPTWLRTFRYLGFWLAVDGWICVTTHQAKLLQTALASVAPPVVVIPQGVDTTFFDPLLATPPGYEPYVLSIGTEMRNYDLLFASVLNLDIEVVVKATSAWMRGSRKSQTMPVPPNVKLITERLSYVELRELYAGAELVIVPLYDTPQAAGITTILEAMAMCKCVIATRSAGLPDILVDNVTGVVTDPTPAALAGAITALRMNPQHRDALAHAGRQAVLSSATIEHHAQQVTNFLLAVHNRVR